jgi:hypothetical protein
MLEKCEIRFLPLGARRVAYEIRGDGPPLVAPAWWVSHLELDWQSAGFRRFWRGVADGYTLIRYDRHGVGMSDRTAPESDPTWRRFTGGCLCNRPTIELMGACGFTVAADDAVWRGMPPIVHPLMVGRGQL